MARSLPSPTAPPPPPPPSPPRAPPLPPTSPAVVANVRVAIDYTAAVNQRAGIGRFVRNLVANLVALDTEDQFVLLHTTPNPGAEVRVPLAPNVTTCEFRFPERWLTILWHRLRVPLPVEWATGAV